MDPLKSAYQDSIGTFKTLHTHLDKPIKTHAKILLLTSHLRLIWCNPVFLQIYWQWPSVLMLVRPQGLLSSCRVKQVRGDSLIKGWHAQADHRDVFCHAHWHFTKCRHHSFGKPPSQCGGGPWASSESSNLLWNTSKTKAMSIELRKSCSSITINYHQWGEYVTSKELQLPICASAQQADTALMSDWWGAHGMEFLKNFSRLSKKLKISCSFYWK